MRVKRSIVTVAPSVEPIDRDDIAKLDLKLDSGTTEDALLDIWIQAAREAIEEKTGLSLITQTREMKLDYFPCEIELLYGPVQDDSVVITYFDENDAEQTVSDSDYWVTHVGPICTITPKVSWPSSKSRPGAVTITYDAGYGDADTDVPAALKSAVLMRLAHLYENRQSVASGQFSEVPMGEDELIGPYIVTQNAGY